MSFSSEAKAEMCRGQISKKCCALSEIYGAFLYGNTFRTQEIKILTESRDFAVRLSKLVQTVFKFFPSLSNLGRKQSLFIGDKDQLNQIFTAFGYQPDRFVAHNINLGVLEEDCCRTSFLRGTFLAGGSVTDPEKSYHLELSCPHYKVNRGTYSILLDMGFHPKDTERVGNYVTYFKNSGTIEDILTTLGAPISAMKIMSTKIEKDMRNSVNRQVNCDTANVDKTLAAAGEQMAAIERLKSGSDLSELPEKLLEVIRLRTENPEASIAELARISEPPVTKSCMSHRLRKIMEISQKK